jgi:hemoglobin
VGKRQRVSYARHVDVSSPYERIGGADGVRRLVTRFYDVMTELPQAATILGMHPEQLTDTRDKFFEFLSGWLGGPQLYIERRGHPRLRMRHLPFAVDDAARDAWMACMQRALAETVHDDSLRAQLESAFKRMADHMRNTGLQARPTE